MTTNPRLKELENDLAMAAETGNDEVFNLIAEEIRALPIESAPQEASAESSPTPPREESGGAPGSFGRTAARTGRALATGAAGVADIPVMAARGVYGLLSGEDPSKNPYLTLPSEAVGQIYDYATGDAGKPATASERILDGAAAALAGGGVAGAAGASSKLIQGGVKEFMRSIGSRSGADFAGDTVGGVLAEWAAENTGNPIAPIIAGIVGGAAGGAAANIPTNRKIKQLTDMGGPAAKSLADQIGDFDTARAAQDAREGLPLALSQGAENPAIDAVANVVASSSPAADAANRRAGGRVYDKMQEATRQALDRNYTPPPAENGIADVTPEGLGERLYEGAKSIQDGLISARRTKAGEAYGKVVVAGNKVDAAKLDDVKDFKDRNGVQNKSIVNAMAAVRGDKLQDFSDIDDNDIVFLDAVYKKLNDQISSIDKPTNEKRLLTQGKKRLEKMMTEEFEGYADAKDLYAADSEILEKNFKGTVLKKITQLKSDKAGTAAQELFKLGPEEIKKARALFVSNGQEAAFNAGVRSYVAGRMESLINGERVNKLARTDTETKKIRNAMTPEAYELFETAVLYGKKLAASNRYATGSDTARRAQGIRRLERDAESKTARAAGTAVRAAVRTAAAARGSLLPTETEIEAIKKLLKNKTFLDEMAGILFNPEESLNFISMVNKRDVNLREAAALAMFKNALDKQTIRSGRAGIAATESRNNQ